MAAARRVAQDLSASSLDILVRPFNSEVQRADFWR
jgi:hypothetical protein